MAQLTNTRIYGTLDVDNVITAKNGINVTPLKNSTDSKDNSAKITLNSVITDNEGNSASNENKLSSIMLSSVNNRYGNLETITSPSSSSLVQHNSLFSYTAEIKNNTAEIKNIAGKLFSLDLHKINSEESKSFDNYGVKTYDINIDDTLYNISVDVSDFYKADNSEPKVSYDKVESAYTTEKTKKPADATTGNFSGNTYTTKSTVNLQLTVPYEGGRIITDKTCDKERIARPFDVRISTTEQLKNLLNSSKFKGCVAGDIINAGPGMILYAVVSYIATGTPSSYPVLFYIKDGSVCMSCFSYSSGIFEKKSSLASGETLCLVVSTKELYDELTNIIA